MDAIQESWTVTHHDKNSQYLLMLPPFLYEKQYQ